MPKMKTHKSLAKRVKVTAKGKVKHKKGGMGHLTGHMSGKTERGLNRPSYMSKAFAKKTKILIGEA